MKKSLIITVLSLLIYGCGSFPTASEYWKIGNTWPGYEQVQNDMLSCGFENTWNNVDMPKNDYIKAFQCMEKKGYLFNGKRTCDRDFHKDATACKGE